MARLGIGVQPRCCNRIHSGGTGVARVQPMYEISSYIDFAPGQLGPSILDYDHYWRINDRPVTIGYDAAADTQAPYDLDALATLNGIWGPSFPDEAGGDYPYKPGGATLLDGKIIGTPKFIAGIPSDRIDRDSTYDLQLEAYWLTTNVVHSYTIWQSIYHPPLPVGITAYQWLYIAQLTRFNKRFPPALVDAYSLYVQIGPDADANITVLPPFPEPGDRAITLIYNPAIDQPGNKLWDTEIGHAYSDERFLVRCWFGFQAADKPPDTAGAAGIDPGDKAYRAY